MPNFLFVYHGGSMPESEEEQTKIMAAWGAWFQGLGDSVVEPGNPVGMSKTVNSDGSVADNGGANPASGYTVVSAGTIDEAVGKAKSCPMLDGGGSVEVAEIHVVEM